MNTDLKQNKTTANKTGKGTVGFNVPLGHFGDVLLSQSRDWCKKLVFRTNHLACTSKTNIVTTTK